MKTRPCDTETLFKVVRKKGIFDDEKLHYEKQIKINACKSD